MPGPLLREKTHKAAMGIRVRLSGRPRGSTKRQLDF